MRICVYCAASARIDKAYFEAAEILAKEFVKNDIEVVYGGGATGLMGKLADTIIEHGGRIQGVIPRFMVDKELANEKVSDLIITDTMHQRKATYLVNIDGVVALPGGVGTLEELLEVMALKRLGKFSKPIIILNTNGFYDSLREMLEKCADENFLYHKELDLWTFVDEPNEVVERIKVQ